MQARSVITFPSSPLASLMSPHFSPLHLFLHHDAKLRTNMFCYIFNFFKCLVSLLPMGCSSLPPMLHFSKLLQDHPDYHHLLWRPMLRTWACCRGRNSRGGGSRILHHTSLYRSVQGVHAMLNHLLHFYLDSFMTSSGSE